MMVDKNTVTEASRVPEQCRKMTIFLPVLIHHKNITVELTTKLLRYEQYSRETSIAASLTRPHDLREDLQDQTSKTRPLSFKWN